MAAEKIYKNKLFPVVVGAVLLSIFNAVAVCVVPANGTTSGTDFEPGMQEGLVRSPEPLEFAAVQLNKNIEFSTLHRSLRAVDVLISCLQPRLFSQEPRSLSQGQSKDEVIQVRSLFVQQ